MIGVSRASKLRKCVDEIRLMTKLLINKLRKTSDIRRELLVEMNARGLNRLAQSYDSRPQSNHTQKS
jgi:hypothetical protein